MIIQLHTPAGLVEFDTLTVTDAELAEYGADRQWLDDTYGDYERARELLATSPPTITMPEMWELMRIYGRFLGLR